jgi:ubiquinone/menaquinone biosynthesis C-methylase UbiE
LSSYRGVGKYHNENERRRWQNPEVILSAIGLKPGDTFMDIGCGEGFFALPAARLVGESGMVYGLDVDSTAMERLKNKAAAEYLRNLNLTTGEAEEMVLCDACADIVFFGIVLHDFREPAKVLRNARRMLKPTGRLVDLDWKKEAMELGPPLHIRFSEKEAARLIEETGFKVETIKESRLYHYLIVAKL